MGIRLGLVLALAVLATGAAPLSKLTAVKRQPLPLTPIRVFDVVRQEFGKWDADKDGVISPAELDAVILNPANRGVPVAAAAAVKNFVANEALAERTAEVTRDYLMGQGFATSLSVYRVEGKEIRDQHGEVIGHWVRWLPSAQALFDAGRRALTMPLPELYGSDGSEPAFSRLSQGALGDCYLIAVLGARAYADPAGLGQMIAASEKGDRGFTVTWGDGVKTTIPALTEGEVALGGGSLTGGLWVRVLEKALAQRIAADLEVESGGGEELGEQSAGGSPTVNGLAGLNLLARGGNPGRAISLVTGHDHLWGTLPGMFKARPEGAFVEKRAGIIRPKIVEAMEKKRVVVFGSAETDRTPPGISPRHAYAVLEFDVGRDVLTMWNPHGSSFTPRGAPGEDNGYLTKDGVFEMPLKEAVSVFGAGFVETGKKVKAGGVKALAVTRPLAIELK